MPYELLLALTLLTAAHAAGCYAVAWGAASAQSKASSPGVSSSSSASLSR